MKKKFEELRVGLDIDGLLACFSCGVIKRAKELGMEDKFPSSCEEVNCWDMSDDFSKVMKDAWKDENFWLTLPMLQPVIGFKPTCYITSRPIPTEVTEKWLKANEFPNALVISVSKPPEKLQHVKDLELDVFVDDLYSTVREMREAGVNAILQTAPYQVGHKAECEGLPTIKALTKEEIMKYV